MAGRQRAGGSAGAGPPTSFPEGTPPIPTHDHSFTLQAVMEMKRDLGVLVERIDRMRDDVSAMSGKVEATSSKVDGINLKLAWLAGICVGITGLVLIVWAVVTQVPWDRIVTSRLAAAPAQQELPARASPLPPVEH